MPEKKITVSEVHGPVMKGLRELLRELSGHPDVKRINADRSFSCAGGKRRGVETGNYDPQRHTLTVRGYLSGGGQEFRLVTSDEFAAERIKESMPGLNIKYGFRS
jgi:hypothetical protein